MKERKEEGEGGGGKEGGIEGTKERREEVF